jgi:hypothetical protein
VLAEIADIAWAAGDRTQARNLMARSARLDPSVGALARWAAAASSVSQSLVDVRRRRAIRSSTYSEAMAWLRHAEPVQSGSPLPIS